MTIQLPILLWTVISFCVLMLLLNRLLFKPLLSFMDARNEKIERARQARDVREQARQAALQAAKEAQLSAAKRAHDEAMAALAEAHTLVAQEAEKQEQAYATLLIQKKTELEVEKQMILQKLDTGTDELVSAFTGKLLQ